MGMVSWRKRSRSTSDSRTNSHRSRETAIRPNGVAMTKRSGKRLHPFRALLVTACIAFTGCGETEEKVLTTDPSFVIDGLAAHGFITSGKALGMWGSPGSGGSLAAIMS